MLASLPNYKTMKRTGTHTKYSETATTVLSIFIIILPANSNFSPKTVPDPGLTNQIGSNQYNFYPVSHEPQQINHPFAKDSLELKKTTVGKVF